MMSLTGRLLTAVRRAVTEVLRSDLRQRKLEEGVRRATGRSEWQGTAKARVVDGDTLALDDLGVTVRLARVDAPERGEFGAQAATDALERALADAEHMDVRIVAEGKYKRAVAEVWLDRTNLSDLLLERGLAERY